MGVFDNNVSNPLSITTIGKDIKKGCTDYLEIKSYFYSMYGNGLPSSMDCERDLRGMIRAYFQQKLEDAGVILWKVSVIKKTFGNAHKSFYINFHWWDTYGEFHKLFDFEYKVV